MVSLEGGLSSCSMGPPGAGMAPRVGQDLAESEAWGRLPHRAYLHLSNILECVLVPDAWPQEAEKGACRVRGITGLVGYTRRQWRWPGEDAELGLRWPGFRVGLDHFLHSVGLWFLMLHELLFLRVFSPRPRS